MSELWIKRKQQPSQKIMILSTFQALMKWEQFLDSFLLAFFDVNFHRLNDDDYDDDDDV